MDFIRNLFSGSAGDTSRYNLWGVAMMIVGALLNAFSRRLSEKTRISESAVKIAGFLVVILGTLIAMKLIG